jgi:branched-chain amino acid aminotransferase
VVPVRMVDTRQVGAGRCGPVTRKLQEVFNDTLRGRGRRSPEWLDIVDVQQYAGSAQKVQQ